MIIFKRPINPSAPMTCARHVYIFTDQGETNTEELKQYLTEHSKKCAWLTGKSAYLILLGWAVGAESHKLGSNDHFVLGAVRDSWSYYHGSPAPSHSKSHTNLVHLMPMLFEDASNIRNLIQDPKIEQCNIRDLLVQMCFNCTESREQEQKPFYDK